MGKQIVITLSEEATKRIHEYAESVQDGDAVFGGVEILVEIGLFNNVSLEHDDTGMWEEIGECEVDLIDYDSPDVPTPAGPIE